MKSRFPWRTALAICLVLASASHALAQGTRVTWPAADWNLNSTNDDVVLPMPCGGAMAFRKVHTSGSYPNGEQALLDDQKIVLGGTEDGVPAMSYLRTGYVAGAFEDRDRSRYYLIGKYEVTNRQLASVTTGDCARPVENASLPVSDVSWYDAIEFARVYNRWLNANAAAALPKANGRSGFLRLPTEVEWEFAARGGLAVSEADRSNTTFLRGNQQLDEYAWYAGAGSSGGEKRPVGQKKPNPLGIYDILGNIEEMILDSFQLVRVSRLHGQAGSVAARGGSFRTPAESLRSSSRVELPMYDASGQQELKQGHVGFRMAVGASAVGDFNRGQALQRRWTSILNEAKPTRQETPLQALERMMRETTEPGVRQQLRDIVASVSDTNRQKSDLAAKFVRQLWLHAGTSLSNVLNSAGKLDDWFAIVQEPEVPGGSNQRKAAARQGLAAERQRFDSLMSSYIELIGELAEADQAQAEAQWRILQREFQLMADAVQAKQLDANKKVLEAYRRNQSARSPAALKNAVVGSRKWLQ